MKTTGHGRRLRRLLSFFTERNVSLRICREVVLYIRNLHLYCSKT